MAAFIAAFVVTLGAGTALGLAAVPHRLSYSRAGWACASAAAVTLRVHASGAATDVRLLAPDVVLWAEVLGSVGCTMLVAAVAATAASRLALPERGSGGARRGALRLCVVAVAATLLWLPRRQSTALGRLVASILAWVTCWKSLELLVAPVELSSREYFAYFISIVEPKLADGKLLPAPRGQLASKLCESLETFLKMCLLSSLCHECNFKPFAVQDVALALAPGALVNVYVQTWMVYLMLQLCLGCLLTVPLLLAGFEPIVVFREPLTRATSPRDFWSRRWNLVVGGLLRRTIFAPLRDARAHPVAAALAAFVMSGAMHEYVWFVTVSGYRLGTVGLFFCLQVPFTAADAFLSRKPSWRAFSEKVPAPLATAFTTLALLPAAPLFLAPLVEGGVLDELGRAVFRVVVLT